MDEATRLMIAALHDEMRSGFASMRDEFTTVRVENEAAHAETRAVLRAEYEAAHAEMRAQNEAAHAETRAVLRAESEAAHAETRAVLRAESAAAHAETRRQSHVLAEDLSARLGEVAEAVQMLDTKVDRNVDRLDARMDHGFAEMVALINWSHSNLDMRLSALE